MWEKKIGETLLIFESNCFFTPIIEDMAKMTVLSEELQMS